MSAIKLPHFRPLSLPQFLKELRFTSKIRGRYKIWGKLREKRIAVEVKKKSLEEVVEIAKSIAALLEHFDFMIKPLNKTAGMTVEKIIGDKIKISI